MNNDERLKTNIQRLRKAKGWKQHHLAEAAGCSLSVVRDIEAKKSKPSLGMLEKLSGALGCEINQLLEGPDLKLPTKSPADMKTEAIGLLLALEKESNIEQVLKTLEILHSSENKSLKNGKKASR